MQTQSVLMSYPCTGPVVIKDISVTKIGRRLGPEAVRQGDTAELHRILSVNIH